MVHVLSMALILGGAAMLSVPRIVQEEKEPVAKASYFRFAKIYEWFFWGAASVVVATGIGNLGAFGSHLPEPNSPWGYRFGWKMIAVVILWFASMWRTTLVVDLACSEENHPWSRFLTRVLYGITFGLGGFIASVAVWLSHG